MLKIVQKDHPVLREKAKTVPINEIKSGDFQKLLRQMSQALVEQEDGVALAAPQIGYLLRIFVVSGRIFEAGFSRNRPPRSDPGRSTPPSQGEKVKDLVFINPKISKLSREKEWMSEGCLSVRPLYGKTYRSKKATIVAYDENGKKFIRGASGLLAQIFQHETDHLNGILFIDHAKDVKAELPK